MSKILTERDIIHLLHEETVRRLREQITIFTPDGTHSLISPELKVKHSDTGLLYVVDAVGVDNIALRTPEGELFTIGHDEFEKDYSLD